MLNIHELSLEKLHRDDVKTLVGYALKEGWNPGEFDAEAFYETDTEGFYGYFYRDQLIAGGSIVSYDGKMGFMGLFIVVPKYRGKGIGEKLWYERRDLLISRLDSDAPIGMDGVIAMQPFYQKGGFEIAFRDERYERIGSEYKVDSNVSNVSKDDYDPILKYDSQCFGVERTQFLKIWLQIPESKAFKYVENGILKGFCMIRKVDQGFKICPLFADDFEVAQKLYETCLNEAIGNPVYLDIPMINSEAVRLVKTYNAQYVFECARMYYGTPPAMELSKVFGITTFELG